MQYSTYNRLVTKVLMMANLWISPFQTRSLTMKVYVCFHPIGISKFLVLITLATLLIKLATLVFCFSLNASRCLITFQICSTHSFQPALTHHNSSFIMQGCVCVTIPFITRSLHYDIAEHVNIGWFGQQFTCQPHFRRFRKNKRLCETR